MTAAAATPLATGLHVHHPATAEALVTTLKGCWAGARSDVFDFDLAVVPGAGFQRWLSQQLAADGVRAGVSFSSLPGLLYRLEGADGWRPERLAWRLQRLAGSLGDPELDLLRNHLAASREPYSACARIARAFAGYAHYRPAMLRAWAAGADTGPDGEPLAENTWQAHLWRLAAAEIGHTPGQRRAALLDTLRSGPVAGVPARVAVLAPTQLSTGVLEVLDALSTHHRVDLLALAPSPGRWATATAAPLLRSDSPGLSGHLLNEALGTTAEEATRLLPAPAAAGRPASGTTLLGWLQDDLRADTVGVRRVLAEADHSVQVHLSHGLDRQVEVLREVLASRLADDPTLEPRQIAVITPDVDAVAPLVAAAFQLPAGADAHPGHRFRVQLADRTIAQVNPMVGLLIELLRLPDSRIEASTVLDLAAEEGVARRFDFSAEDRDRLAELVEVAGVRWGLWTADRRRFGLDTVQNTWFAGVQRMLLGVALAEDDLVAAGSVLPLDDVDSSDVTLIGGLTELIGRLMRAIAAFATPTTAAEWTQRCRHALESLVSLPPTQEWQLGVLWAGLARIAERAGEAQLTRHALLKVVTEEFADSARGAFGNGSLIVAGPSSLRHVPHRVVVLLGWDAERYPRTGRRHGDDLLGLSPRVGDPSPVLDDRQLLLDALHAAREHFVVVARGRSEATNETVPLAAPLQELLDALNATAVTATGTPAGAAVTVQHPLQPFDRRYFDPSEPGLRSVDPVAYRGALAGLTEPQTPPGRYRLGTLTPPDLSRGVELDDLVGFFGHPVRALLRQRVQLGLREGDEASDSIPIDPNGLERWQIAGRVLQQLQAGADPADVRRAELLRGGVPPARLGGALIDQVLRTVDLILAKASPELAKPRVPHDLALSVQVPGVGAVPLTGRVFTYGETVLQLESGRLQPRHSLTAWLRLLAASAAGVPVRRAVLVGNRDAVAIGAPPPAAAAELVGRYLALYSLGLTTPLPATPRVTAEWAQLRGIGDDPLDPRNYERLKKAWERDTDPNWAAFFSFPGLLRLSADGVALPPPGSSDAFLVGALAELVWQPLRASEEDL